MKWSDCKVIRIVESTLNEEFVDKRGFVDATDSLSFTRFEIKSATDNISKLDKSVGREVNKIMTDYNNLLDKAGKKVTDEGVVRNRQELFSSLEDMDNIRYELEEFLMYSRDEIDKSEFNNIKRLAKKNSNKFWSIVSKSDMDPFY